VFLLKIIPPVLAQVLNLLNFKQGRLKEFPLQGV
jgi:hypothetical protein